MSTELSKAEDILQNMSDKELAEISYEKDDGSFKGTLLEYREKLAEETSVSILGHKFRLVKYMPLGIRYGYCGASEDEYYCIPADNVILFYTPKGLGGHTPSTVATITEEIYDETTNRSNYRVINLPEWDDPSGPTEPKSLPTT